MTLPTPLEIKEITNPKNAAKTRRQKKAVPKPKLISANSVPKGLSEEERKVWLDVASQLELSGMLSIVDLRLVARYASLSVKWDRACKTLAGYGATSFEVYDKDGRLSGIRQYPEVKERDALSNQLLAIEKELGMTPLSRVRMGLALADRKNKEVDPFDYQ